MDKTKRRQFLPHDVTLPEQEAKEGDDCWRPDDQAVEFATLMLIERHAQEFQALVNQEERARLDRERR